MLSGLRFAQPFLLANAVNWVGDKDASSNIGYGLIGAFAFVYIGLAVSCAILP
jgi:ATP-binding cassette subfamily C (CFTR/MRP) protein 1